MVKFGTGGFRAIIGDEFTKTNLRLIGQALCIRMEREGLVDKRVVIGYDRRFLSDIASKWLAEVFAGNGAEVLFISHDAPTPMIMYLVKQSGAHYGAAVTASHNPAEYNGVKLFTAGGCDASVEVTQDIEEIIASIRSEDVKTMPFAKAKEAGLVKVVNPQNDYVDSILSVLDIKAIKKRGLRILLDPMYGVSKTSLQTVLLTCRCDVDVINDRHDALFGGKLPSPSAQTLGRLAQLVVEGGYDLGIGTDGDADRVGIIDAEGRFIHPNDILVLIYYYLVKHKGWKGDVVRSVATTHMLDDMAADFGTNCYEVPVGFKYVSSKMNETDALVGGESSGGLTVRGHINGKDGIYAASLIVEMMCVMGKPLGAILKDIHARYGDRQMSEYDCRFSNETKARINEQIFLRHELPDFHESVERVSYLDGCKVYFKNNGWIICRFSGTEPLIRIFCEMPTLARAKEITTVLTNFIGLGDVNA